MHRQLLLRVVAALAAALLLAACGPEAPPTADGPVAYVPIIAASELGVGSNRLPIGLLSEGTPVNDPNLILKLRLFYLDGGQPEKVQAEAQAVYRGEGLPFGIYVAYVDLPQAGGWAAEVQIPRPQGEPQVTRMRLDVSADSQVPAVGQPAIPSRNLTTRDVPELKQLTSDPQPDPALYELTIADALAAKKPFLVIFSTPGYCQTAVCAPNMLVVKKLREQFGRDVNFIHVEVYPYPFGQSFERGLRVPALDEWRLRTEPWTFLVDAEGIIQGRYEGGITFSEMEPALARLSVGEAPMRAP